MVEPLHSGVGPEQLEALEVGLPEELDPRHEDGAVRPVLGTLARHGRQHDHLGGGDVLKIIHLGNSKLNISISKFPYITYCH